MTNGLFALALLLPLQAAPSQPTADAGATPPADASPSTTTVDAASGTGADDDVADDGGEAIGVRPACGGCPIDGRGSCRWRLAEIGRPDEKVCEVDSRIQIYITLGVRLQILSEVAREEGVLDGAGLRHGSVLRMQMGAW